MTVLPALLAVLALSSPSPGPQDGSPPVLAAWPELPTLEGTPAPVTMTLPEALAEASRQSPTLEQARARARGGRRRRQRAPARR